MGLVVRMGEGKSRWWWKSLNRRTKLAYWRREAREGILNGAWEEEGRGAKFVSEFDGKKLDRFERASECGGGGIPKGRTVLKVRAHEGGVEVEDDDRRGVAVEMTKDEA